MGKLAALVFYIIAICSPFVSALQPYSQILLTVLGVLQVVHVAEYLLLRKRLSKIKTDDSHFLQTLLFGFVYWLPLLKGQAKSQSES